MAVGLFQVDVNYLIDINGAVIAFFFLYLIPAVLHIKCLYFSRGKKSLPAEEDILGIAGDGDGEAKRRGTAIEITGVQYPFEKSKQALEQPLLR